MNMLMSEFMKFSEFGEHRPMNKIQSTIEFRTDYKNIQSALILSDLVTQQDYQIYNDFH